MLRPRNARYGTRSHSYRAHAAWDTDMTCDFTKKCLRSTCVARENTLTQHARPEKQESLQYVITAASPVAKTPPMDYLAHNAGFELIVME
ncbi:hypothetical protein EVAR_103028_1 [Eumeta japonica]|uniref:Uncharacterized protein n=1 Tax=Eumeta variegata TaxID=151549 RepID=A0A4C1WC83_EUMVA|nr:hypothetical protein EVAR_103028_1 [Eumeta japonica]